MGADDVSRNARGRRLQARWGCSICLWLQRAYLWLQPAYLRLQPACLRLQEERWREGTVRMRRTDAALHAGLEAAGYRLDFGADGSSSSGSKYQSLTRNIWRTG